MKWLIGAFIVWFILCAYCEVSIRDAVKEGKKKTLVYVGTAVDTPVLAQSNYDNHGYLDLIKKVIAKLRRNRYTVTQGVEASEHREYHEYSDDYVYFLHHPYLKIEWK